MVTASSDGGARIWDLSALAKQWAAEEKRREDQRALGYFDLDKERASYGFSQLTDFLQFGNGNVRKMMDWLSGQGDLADTEDENRVWAALRTAQEEVARKRFYDEYVYSVSYVQIDGDTGSFRMTIPIKFGGFAGLRVEEIVFSMPNVTGKAVDGTSIVLTVSGTADSIRELVDNSGDYRVGVWFTNLRRAPADAATANVLKIEVINVK